MQRAREEALWQREEAVERREKNVRDREEKVVELEQAIDEHEHELDQSGSELDERSKRVEVLEEEMEHVLLNMAVSKRVHFGTWFGLMVDYSSSVCRFCVGGQNVFVPPLLLPSFLP